MTDPYAGLVEWRIDGEHGLSSVAIADRLQYGRTRRDPFGWRLNWPLDPADFRRCQLLFAAAPGMRADLDLMRDQGPEWSALVDRWDDIAATFAEEVPDYLTSTRWAAPRTYALMKTVLDSATTEETR